MAEKDTKRTMNSESRVLYIVRLLMEKWKQIMFFVIAIIIIVSVYIFSIPRTYTSQAILLPETSSSTSLSGNLGSIASLAGIRMGNMTGEDAIYPEFYPKVLSSTTFLVDLSKEKITSVRIGKGVSLYSYFNNYQKKSWWSFIHSDKEKDNNAKIDPRKPTKGQGNVLRSIEKSFVCMVDKKTDMITIRVSVQDADVAAQIADLICKHLQNYITDYRTTKARKDMEYIKKITSEAKGKYLIAQAKYSNFSDSNNDIILSSYSQIRDRLENEMQLAYNMYSQTAQQLQLAQAKLQERTPAFVTIQPAVIPLKPSAPKRMVTIFICTLLALMGSVLWIMGKDYLNSK